MYDFGQLNVDTEKDYTKQIVLNRCKEIPELRGDGMLMDLVPRVLAWSQNYMRKRKVSQSQNNAFSFQ